MGRIAFHNYIVHDGSASDLDGFIPHHNDHQDPPCHGHSRYDVIDYPPNGDFIRHTTLTSMKVRYDGHECPLCNPDGKEPYKMVPDPDREGKEKAEYQPGGRHKYDVILQDTLGNHGPGPDLCECCGETARFRIDGISKLRIYGVPVVCVDMHVRWGEPEGNHVIGEGAVLSGHHKIRAIAE